MLLYEKYTMRRRYLYQRRRSDKALFKREENYIKLHKNRKYLMGEYSSRYFFIRLLKSRGKTKRLVFGILKMLMKMCV